MKMHAGSAPVASDGLRDISPFFSARTLAIVGAAENPQRLGGRVQHFARKFGFPGKVFPVNPNRDVVQGEKSYPTPADLPCTPDIAVVALRADLSLEAVRTLAQMGTKGVVVISGGFAEGGGDASLQQQLREVSAEYGLMVVGPNCIGLADLHTASIPCAMADLELPGLQAGPVSVVTQSGGIGGILFGEFARRRLYVGKFVATGNEADVDVADAISTIASDEGSRVIVCFVEAIRRPSAMRSALANAHEAGKPVIICKAGRSDAGRKGAASHTGAVAGSAGISIAALRAWGGIVVESIGEALAASELVLSGVPVGKPSRPVFLAWSGGATILAVDEAQEAGVALARLGSEVCTELESAFPFLEVDNPLDMTGRVVADDSYFPTALKVLSKAPECGLLVQCFTPTMPRFADHVVDSLGEARQAGQAIACIWPTSLSEAHAQRLRSLNIAALDDERAAMRALSALEEYKAPSPDEEYVSRALPSADCPTSMGLQSEAESKRLLREAGFPIVRGGVEREWTNSSLKSLQLRWPRAVKVQRRDLPHKSDHGLVHLSISNEQQLAQLCQELQREHQDQPDYEGLLIEEMANDGTDILVGAVKDQELGLTVVVSLGGFMAEAVPNPVYFTPPVPRHHIQSLIATSLLGHVIDGYRGNAGDLEALVDLVEKVCEFVMQAGNRLEEMDLNPVRVHEKGCGVEVLDALLRFKEE